MARNIKYFSAQSPLLLNISQAFSNVSADFLEHHFCLELEVIMKVSIGLISLELWKFVISL